MRDVYLYSEKQAKELWGLCPLSVSSIALIVGGLAYSPTAHTSPGGLAMRHPLQHMSVDAWCRQCRRPTSIRWAATMFLDRLDHSTLFHRGPFTQRTCRRSHITRF